MSRAATITAVFLLVVGLRASEVTAGTLTLRLQDAVPLVTARGTTIRHDLLIHIPRGAPGWGAHAWAWVPALPGMVHPCTVTVTDTTVTCEVRLRIYRSRSRISWPGHGGRQLVIGGHGRITVAYDPTAGTGEYTATFGSDKTPYLLAELEDLWGLGPAPGRQAVQQRRIKDILEAWLGAADTRGAVVATWLDRPGFDHPVRAVARDEHPRLLLRRSDLPRLRELVKAGDGKVLVEAMDALLEQARQHGFGYLPPCAEAYMSPIWGVGHALRYQLDGDAAEAERAWNLCSGGMVSPLAYGGWWAQAERMMGVALCYDLCFDAWPPERRQRVYAYLVACAQGIAMRDDVPDPVNAGGRYLFSNLPEDRRCSGPIDGEFARFQAAGLLCALAIRGDTPLVHDPIDPAAVPLIGASTEYAPWIGVPVVPFEDDRMASRWLTNGPFPKGVDPLADAGGLGPLRPEPGEVIRVDGIALDWRPYRPAGVGSWEGPRIYPRDCGRFWTSSTGKGYPPGLELVRKWQEASGRQRVGYNAALSTVVRFDRTEVVQARQDWGSNGVGSRLWLSGHELADGAVVRVEAGLHPLMVLVDVTGGYANQFPRLASYGPMARRRDREGCERAKTILADGFVEDCGDALAADLDRFLREAVDDGGLGLAHPANILVPALLAWRNVTGRDLAAGTGLRQAVVFGIHCRGMLDGRNADILVGQGCAFGDVRARQIARWYRQVNGPGVRRPTDAVVALVAGDLNAEPLAPSACMDRNVTWSRPGVQCFASGLDGSRDFRVVVDEGREPFCSRHGAGAIALYGDGRTWFPRVAGMLDFSSRTQCSTAFASDRYRALPATVVRRTAGDGGGAITLRNDAFVTARWHPAADKRDSDRWISDGPASGVAITRHVGVDYTGRAGVPALIVIADRFAGLTRHDPKHLVFDCGQAAFKNMILDEAGQAFRIEPAADKYHPDATLKLVARFLAPRPVHLRFVFDPDKYHPNTWGRLFVELDGRYRGPQGRADKDSDQLAPLRRHEDQDKDIPTERIADRDLDAAMATTLLELEEAEHPVEDLVIWTVISLLPGDPPPLTITGEGATARLHVGGTVVRLVDDAVVFE